MPYVIYLCEIQDSIILDVFKENLKYFASNKQTTNWQMICSNEAVETKVVQAVIFLLKF